MPVPVKIDLAENQLFFHFETNNVIEVENLTTFLTALAAYARGPDQLGPETKIVLRRLISGSPTSVWVDVLNVVGVTAGVGQLGIAVLMMIETRKASKVSESLGRLIFDSDTVSLDYAFREPGGGAIRRVKLARTEIPAVGRAATRAKTRRRRRLQRPVTHQLYANGIETGPPVLGNPALAQNPPPGTSPSERSEEAFVGTFRLEGVRDYFLDTEDQTFLVLDPSSDLPLGEERVVSGVLTSDVPPAIHIRSMTKLNSDGEPGVTTEFLNESEGWRRPGVADLARGRVSLDNDASTSEADDDGWVEILGTFVSAFDGRFRLFRSQSREYRLFGPDEVLTGIPTDREVIVSARVGKDGVLQLTNWRLFENDGDAGRERIVDRALLQGSMIATTNGTFFTASGGAVYRAEGSSDLLGNFMDATILAIFTDRKDAEGHQVIKVTRRLSPKV